MAWPSPIDGAQPLSQVLTDLNTYLDRVNQDNYTTGSAPTDTAEGMRRLDGAAGAPRRPVYVWHPDDARWVLVEYLGTTTDSDSATVVGHTATGEHLVLSAPALTETYELEFPTGAPPYAVSVPVFTAAGVGSWVDGAGI